jgi:hypothetical protein
MAGVAVVVVVVVAKLVLLLRDHPPNQLWNEGDGCATNDSASPCRVVARGLYPYRLVCRSQLENGLCRENCDNVLLAVCSTLPTEAFTC